MWKPRLVNWSQSTSLSPAAVDQRDHLSVFFLTSCSRNWTCDQKSLLFSLKNQSKFCPQLQPWQIFIWPVLDNHCWPRFDSQVWRSPTDFSSGWFCWTQDQRIIKPRIKNSRHFWNLFYFEKFRTKNIGKGWPNKNIEKIYGQNQTESF